jgi:MFS superfamily sulfate permease-like transporter
MNDLSQFLANRRADAVSGFLVFLIALPLCFGIAIASGFPPMAGIFSGIIGGLVVSRLNGSLLTITGPAAGLITVLLASVQALGEGDAAAGYRYTLAAIVIAGGLQVLLGIFKAGRIAAFFPAAIAHGMLAAIGIMIIARQAHILLGAKPDAVTPWQNLSAIPRSLLYFNPEVFLVGLIGLVILFAWPLLKNRGLGRLPAPIIVIVIGYGLGQGFDLNQAELYVGSMNIEGSMLPRLIYTTAPQFLADVPDRLLDSVVWPDFSKLATWAFWNAVVSLFLIGSLESLLAASAVDRLDPEKRRSNLNRDVAAIGIGNMLSGAIGGMPMIAEIVRSSANIGYGARSGWSNFFHGLFLLLFIILIPHIIRGIPVASLAALLIFAAYHLVSPRAFTRTLEVGVEQLALFLVTVVAILATNLLAGVAIAIAVKLVIHYWRGVPLHNLFQLAYEITREPDGAYHIKINGAAVFSNFFALKGELNDLPGGENIVFDLTYASLVDHTVMDFIDRFRREYVARGGQCDIHGLDRYQPYSDHPLAARRQQGIE